jgi:hypothetical protein
MTTIQLPENVVKILSNDPNFLKFSNNSISKEVKEFIKANKVKFTKIYNTYKSEIDWDSFLEIAIPIIDKILRIGSTLSHFIPANMEAGFFNKVPKEKQLSREEAEEVFKKLGSGINQVYKKHVDVLSWTNFFDICINLIRLIMMK